MKHETEQRVLKTRNTTGLETVFKCSTSLATSKTQVKTVLRCWLTLVRMDKMKKKLTTEIGLDADREERLFTVGGSANYCSHYENYCGSSITYINRFFM